MKMTFFFKSVWFAYGLLPLLFQTSDSSKPLIFWLLWARQGLRWQQINATWCTVFSTDRTFLPFLPHLPHYCWSGTGTAGCSYLQTKQVSILGRVHTVCVFCCGWDLGSGTTITDKTGSVVVFPSNKNISATKVPSKTGHGKHYIEGKVHCNEKISKWKKGYNPPNQSTNQQKK